MRYVFLILAFLIPACSAIGPQIASEEERRSRAMLMLEAKAWQRKQQERVNDLAGRLARATGAGSALKFIFVANPEQSGGKIPPDIVNAWTDGEGVWITRGMMRFLKNDDEVGVVLSHEMAHALRGHMAFLRMQQILGLALTIPAGIYGGQAGGNLAGMLAQAATTKFDRDREREADLYGLIWAHRAGFNVDVAKDVFRRMAIEMPESMESGFLSSHPSSTERFLAMEKIAEALKLGLDPLKVFAPKEDKGEKRSGDDQTR